MPDYPYNLTNFVTSRDMIDLAKASDGILGGTGIFGTFILVTLGIVSFMVMRQKGYHPSACFSVGAWVIMLTSWLLRAMDLIGNNMMWGCTILAVVSVGVLYLSNNPQ